MLQIKTGQSKAVTPPAPDTIAVAAPALPAQFTPTEAPALPAGSPRRVRVPLKHRAQFFRQFATCIHAGMGLTATLQHLQQETSNSALREAARKAQICAERGGKLSAWMTTRPAVFSRAEAAMVLVGETSGFLDKALDRIASDLETDLMLQKRLFLATFFSKFILFPLLVIVPGISQVIPAGLEALSHTSGLSEGAQQQLILHAGLQHHWHTILHRLPWVALLIALSYTLPYAIDAKPVLRRWRDQVLLWIPGIGSLRRDLATSRYLTALSLLSEAGLTSAPALEACSGTAGNVVLDEKFAAAAALARRTNASIATALAQSGIFNATTVSLMRTGEQAGAMPDLLDRAANFYESDTALRLQSVPKIVGVAVFLLAALFTLIVVGSEVKAVYHQIYEGVDKFMFEMH